MSKYSGKCDFYDYIEIHSLNKVLASNIYIGDNPVPLRISSQEDCIPYYAHLVILSGTTYGIGNVVLSSESYIDTEEKEHLNWILRDALRYYNRCKRNKVPFIEEECLSKICIWDNPKNYEKEIVHRVSMYGKKADIHNIHCDSSNRERMMLYDKMIFNGYSSLTARNWLWKNTDYATIDHIIDHNSF